MAKGLARATPAKRLHNSSLALGALVTYQTNALLSRPEEGRAETALLQAACQHTLDSTTSETIPTMYQRGAYFVSDIVFEGGSAIGIPPVRPIDEPHLLICYARDFMADIEIELQDDLDVTASSRAKHTRKRLQTLSSVETSADPAGSEALTARQAVSLARRRQLALYMDEGEDDGLSQVESDDDDELAYRVRQLRAFPPFCADSQLMS